MIDKGEQKFEYKGYHMRVEWWCNEYVGEIIETGEKILANKIEWMIESFHEVVEGNLFVEKFFSESNGGESFDDGET